MADIAAAGDLAGILGTDLNPHRNRLEPPRCRRGLRASHDQSRLPPAPLWACGIAYEPAIGGSQRAMRTTEATHHPSGSEQEGLPLTAAWQSPRMRSRPFPWGKNHPGLPASEDVFL